jgi:hypothetical protein
VVGVLLVVGPRVVADDRVDLQEPDEIDEAQAQLGPRDAVHPVVVVVEVEDLLQPEDAGHLVVVLLVGEDRLADRARPRHVVVRHADEVPRVALVEELGHRPRREERDVVRVRLDGEQNLALVRPPGLRPLDDDARHLLAARGAREPLWRSGQRGPRRGRADELASLHRGPPRAPRLYHGEAGAGRQA